MSCRKYLLCLTAFAAGVTFAQPTNGESFGEWFRRVGKSISHPQKHSSPRPHSEKSRSSSPSPAPVNVTPTPSSTPQVPIKAAVIVTEARNSKRDLPYAIPVPNKEGFVTSPYAPSQGMVDVRGIPSGTEVKDPFTGKLFRTP